MYRIALLFLVVVLYSGTLRAQNNPIENLAPTGNLGPLITAIESARTFPVFILPLGSGYYDFELKASITNWSGGVMVYFYASAVDQTPSNTSLPIWDPSIKIFFTLATATDARSWQTANPALTLYQQSNGANGGKLNQVVVIPSKVAASTSWMYKGNTQLVWSYVRISAVGPEKDSNNNVVWNPIVPVDWRLNQTTP